MTRLSKWFQFPRFLLRFLIALVVVLSLLAGYYQQGWSLEIKKYRRLEDMYVRLRDQVGADTAKDLINQSYQK